MNKRLRLSYFRGQLDDFYSQDFFGLLHTLPLRAGVLTSDLRYFFSRNEGNHYSGQIDNGMFSGQLSFAVAGHTVAVGYQRLHGNGGLPYINDATVYSFSNVGIRKFIEEDEKTWLASYGYDFRQLGLPGLSFMTHYISGSDGKSGPAGVNEWERDIELAYVVPTGTLKGLGVKLRNHVYRSDTARGRDSNRLYLTYDIAVW